VWWRGGGGGGGGHAPPPPPPPPPFHPLPAALACGFLPGTSGTGRDERYTIGLREFGVGPSEGGRIAMRSAHGGLEMIRAHDLGHPTQRRTGAAMGPDPVGQTLAPGRFSKGRVGGAQDGDAARGGANCPREGIDDRHRLARIGDKERVAYAGALPHAQSELASPRAIGVTALAVLEAIGGDSLVCLPQQDHCAPGRVRSRGTVVQSGAGRLATGVFVTVAHRRLSRARSSRVSGRGQARPAACARRTDSATGGG
jgi:hypothetical protein